MEIFGKLINVFISVNDLSAVFEACNIYHIFKESEFIRHGIGQPNHRLFNQRIDADPEFCTYLLRWFFILGAKNCLRSNFDSKLN